MGLIPDQFYQPFTTSIFFQESQDFDSASYENLLELQDVKVGIKKGKCLSMEAHKI